MPKILTRLRIDEVSAVDRGAGDGVKIMLMKRADDSDRRSLSKAERWQRYEREYLGRHARYARSFNGIMAKSLADADDDGDVTGTGTDKRVDHHASTVADLLVEAGSHPDRASALSHLLHNPHGQALLARMHKKDEPMTSTSHSEFVRNVVKTYGITALAKSMVDHTDSYGLDEHQFTQLATEHAARLYPNDRPDAAFSKLYQSEESVRRACQLAKAWPAPMSLEPMVATGAAAFPSARRRSGSSPGRADGAGDVDSVGVSDAYEQLVAMAERQHRAGESASAAFMRVYLDPANRHLAEAERAQNRPRPVVYGGGGE